MRLRIDIGDDLADQLLEQGLKGLPSYSAEQIRTSPARKSEVIRQQIYRYLAPANAALNPQPDLLPVNDTEEGTEQ